VSLTLEEKVDDIKNIKYYDKYNLINLIERLPEQIEYVINELNKNIVLDDKVNQIGVVGVGTTKVCAEIIKSFADRFGQIPICSLDEYLLPNWVNKNTLLIFISFSGNTEEVISCFKKAINVGCKSIVITSGGQLEEIANENHITVIKVPKEKPENRTVLPFMLIPAMIICFNVEGLPVINTKFLEVAEFLKGERKKLKIQSPCKDNIAKKIAIACYNKIPLIYTDDSYYHGLLLRWQYQFNENAKKISYSAILPNMGHNELVGLQNTDFSENIIVIFLRNIHQEQSKWLLFTRGVLEEKKYNIIDIPMLGSNYLDNIFYGVFLADYVSYYSAILRDLDPHVVEVIDKMRL